jgi:hypothetical protein
MTNRIVSHIKPFLIVLVTVSDLPIPKASLPNGLFVDVWPTPRNKGLPGRNPALEPIPRKIPLADERMNMLRHYDISPNGVVAE